MKNCKKEIIYITYDGILENIGDSQITSYIIKLSKINKINLISFEKDEYLENKKNFIKIKKKLISNNINWKYFKYHNKPYVLGTLYNIIIVFFYLFRLNFKRNNYIYHCRSYLPTFFCYLISYIFNIKYIYDMRGFWPDEKAERTNLNKSNFIYYFLKFIEKRLLINSSFIITLTQQAKEIIQEKYKFLKSSNIMVLPTCVDTNLFKPMIRNEKINSKIIFCYLGSIDGAYDINMVISFFSELVKFKSNLNLKIITSKTNEVRKIIEKHDVDKSNIEVINISRDKIAEAINSIDIGIFYLKENFSIKGSYPTKIGEFLSTGKPIICNNFNNDILYSIKNNNIGINTNFNKEDINIIVDYLNHFINNKNNISHKCREFALSKLSLNTAVDKLNNIYLKLIK